MYGSIHTHVESQYDTGNDKRKMMKRFIDMGAKRVAITEHGVFSSYEDLKEIVDEIKASAEKDGLPIPDFDVIPGVEGYLGDSAAHIILVAKDYEGYVSLCKIISESNTNVINGKPIITMENLRKNVAKGHLICTSACIGGPFGLILGTTEHNLREKVSELTETLGKSKYESSNSFIEYYEEFKKQNNKIKPTKAEITKAEKFFKKTDNRSQLQIIEARLAKYEANQTWLEEHLKEYEDANAYLKSPYKAGSKTSCKAYFSKKLAQLEKAKEDLAQLEARKIAGEIELQAKTLLSDLLSIFGNTDFYFELQNHGIEIETNVYRNLVEFAYRNGHPRFIASNDIHLGVHKSDAEYESMLLRRKVMKFTRFNTYEEDRPDDKEYTIKTNDELREELLKIIPSINGVSAEEIVDGAIGNIEFTLSDCHVEFPKDQNHYPKFCEDENAEFERQVREGIKQKFPNGFPDERYEKRLVYEMGIIKQMGYAGYHLIVSDYLRYAKLLGFLPTQEEIDNSPLTISSLDAYITERGYPRIGYNTGPGRGSGCGSLCCYLLDIADVDPIPYDLLFERFLNPERVSMPKQYWAFSVNPITQGCA